MPKGTKQAEEESDMTFNDVCEHIRETANDYGFEVTQDRHSRLPIIRSEELNFFLMEEHEYNRVERTVTTHIQATASVRKTCSSMAATFTSPGSAPRSRTRPFC